VVRLNNRYGSVDKEGKEICPIVCTSSDEAREMTLKMIEK